MSADGWFAGGEGGGRSLVAGKKNAKSNMVFYGEMGKEIYINSVQPDLENIGKLNVTTEAGSLFQ